MGIDFIREYAPAVAVVLLIFYFLVAFMIPAILKMPAKIKAQEAPSVPPQAAEIATIKTEIKAMEASIQRHDADLLQQREHTLGVKDDIVSVHELGMDLRKDIEDLGRDVGEVGKKADTFNSKLAGLAHRVQEIENGTSERDKAVDRYTRKTKRLMEAVRIPDLDD